MIWTRAKSSGYNITISLLSAGPGYILILLQGFIALDRDVGGWL